MKSLRRVFALALLLSFSLVSFAQQPPLANRDWSKDHARHVVEWARDGVIYEIWERAFSPAGNFNGITARLDELKKTGVNILWLMPVNPIGIKDHKGSIGSPYAVRNYYGINPAYGTKADLQRLVNEAHKRGMKVILDVVLNHTSWDNKLITEHPDFYRHNAAGKIIYPEDWTDVAWLDYSNPKLRRYIIRMLKYWLTTYHVDGFRCDVAHFIPTDFWDEARAELQKVDPNIFLLAEGHRPDEMVKAFDSDYSWPLLTAMNDVFEARKPATEIAKTWQEEHDTFPQGTLHMRMSDDHDETRAIVRYGEQGALAAQALVFTLDGIPLVYNGMEVGDSAESGAPALFEKVPIIWGIAARRPEFPPFYQKMIALRKSNPAILQGDVEWLKNSAADTVITFLRKTAGEEVLVAINTSSSSRHFTISGVTPDGWSEITPKYLEHPPEYPAMSGTTVDLQPWGFRIFRRGAVN